MNEINQYRAIWLSDFHLGTRNCKADYILDFLRHNESEYLYLVGDIIDGWALKRSWYWEQAYNDVIQKLLRKSRKGTNITYIPGNHDEFAREFFNLQLGRILVKSKAIHTTAKGQQLLIIHGDEFDGLIAFTPWLSKLGAHLYQYILGLNRFFNHIRRRLGLPYWSLSAFLKDASKRAVQYVAAFEEAVVREAKKWEVDGIVCGHIHRAEQRDIDGIAYLNAGDWVESCTALVEHTDGRLEIIRWAGPDHASAQKTKLSRRAKQKATSQVGADVPLLTALRARLGST